MMNRRVKSIMKLFNNTDEIEELTPSRRIQFWTILSFEIPSLICAIYVLCNLLRRKHLRQALHNHVIIILLFLTLVVEIIDNPLYLDAYHHQGQNSFSSSSSVCLLWWLVDYGVYGAINVLFTWTSLERHILIFSHRRFLNTRKKRCLFHYAPLTLILIYLTGFYIGIIIFPPCENSFDFHLEACGMSPCYESVHWLNIWDYMINGVVCAWLEFFSSILLLARLIYRRYRAKQSIYWKKHRLMTIQVLSISVLSLSITLPQAIITNIQRIYPSMENFGTEVSDYFFFLTNFVVLLFPFLCLTCLSELWPSRWSMFRNETVVPLQLISIKPVAKSFLSRRIFMH